MAGSGWKVFQAGAVLPASEVNGYLMDQSVMVFAGTAARGSAIGTAASEGMMSYRTDENVLETFDGSQWVPSTAMTPTSLTGRNLLYNSAMQVAQRGTSTTGITTVGFYTADRWRAYPSGLGTWTQTVEDDGPTGSGLRKSLKMLCTTADTSPAASDFNFLAQPLEGQDLQRISKGTASAQQLTVSFWVKSNVTGTYVCELLDSDNNRICSKQYTISASATWEKKTITFPADTTGAFDNDNSSSMEVRFWLGAGTDYSSGTLQTTWATLTQANRAVGQTNLAAATNNYWQVTGVQLEVGPVATPFEFESYGDTLRKCQRYYWRISGSDGSVIAMAAQYTTTTAFGVIHLPVTMRAAPSGSSANGTNYFSREDSGAGTTFNTFAGVDSSTPNTIRLNASISGTTGRAGWFLFKTTSAYIEVSAEL